MKRNLKEDLEPYSLSRFDEQDIILESDQQIQEFLPDILGQALARTWVDKRFLNVFCDRPKDILEQSGVFCLTELLLSSLKRTESVLKWWYSNLMVPLPQDCLS